MGGAAAGVAVVLAAGAERAGAGQRPADASLSDAASRAGAGDDGRGRRRWTMNSRQAAQAAAMKKIGHAAFFDPAIAFVTGPADAKNTLVEFYDYDCPYCRASLPAVKKFYDAHKDKTRASPSSNSPSSSLHGESAVLAARASLAARRQPDHYMDFHFALAGPGRSDDRGRSSMPKPPRPAWTSPSSRPT